MALVPSEASQHIHGDYGDTDEVSNSGSRGKRKASQVWAHFTKDVCEIKLRMTEWEYSEKDYIRSMSGPMLTKFEKYWDECSLVLAVAVVFDPRFKMDLVEYFYTKIYALNAHSYIQSVRDILVKLFVEYGGNLFPSVSDSLYDSSCGGSATLRDFDRWYEESRSMVNKKSELDSYLEDPRFPRVDTFNILDWWRTNSPKLPTLAKIARDILAVPATTVASETTFSVGGRVIDEHRSCLLPDVVQGLIVADDWIDSLEHLAI